MPNPKPSLAPELSPDDEIQFANDHRISLQPGRYQLTVTQTLDYGGGLFTANASQEFAIRSERFVLPPDQIHAVYPPKGSRGNFWRVLPHIVLERSTLPWERTSLQGGHTPETDPAWLAVLVFHESDLAKFPALAKSLTGIETATVGALKGGLQGAPAYFPAIKDLDEHVDDEQVAYIDVPWGLLSTLLPQSAPLDGTGIVLSRTTHVRRRLAFLGNGPATGTTDELVSALQGLVAEKKLAPPGERFDQRNIKLDGVPEPVIHLKQHDGGRSFEIWSTGKYFEVAHESAIVLSSRLPRAGERNLVQLVSLEGRVDANGAFIDLGAKAANGLVRLISLARWEFFCTSETRGFRDIVEGLNEADHRRGSANAQHRADWGMPTKNLPDTSDALAMVKAGNIPLRHFLRQGDRTVSWYRGPLVPAIPDISPAATPWRGSDPRRYAFSVRCADELVFFDERQGMFDVSYAAAWELGRHLTLANTKVAIQQLHWKRSHAHSLNAARHVADLGYHIAIQHDRQLGSSPDALPAALQSWLDGLSVLKHVPFHYLVPKEELLPPESLRFFSVDPLWIQCLRDGAFSVGRVFRDDHVRESIARRINDHQDQQVPLSGILVRSEVIAGWPNLQFNAYSDVPAQQTVTGDVPGVPQWEVVQRDQRSKNVLMVLFAPPGSRAGDTSRLNDRLRVLDIHLRPEMQHFGLEEHDGKLVKEKRDDDGNVLREPTSKPGESAVQWATPIILGDDGHGFVDLEKLAESLGAKGEAGVFGMKLTSGVPLVRFQRPDPSR